MDLDELDALDPVAMTDPSTEGRPYSIVVYGASGYCGRLIAEHLDSLMEHGRMEPIRWAIAGRSKIRLRDVARRCTTTPDMIEASDPSGVSTMCRSARVVVNAAGPFLTCGEDVVRECVNQVTHYIDIAGDICFIKAMIDKYHERARERGAVIVNFAASMCAPNELFCLSLVNKLGPLRQYRDYMNMYGAISGGTYNSSRVLFENFTAMMLATLHDPFALGGLRECGLREEDKDMTEAVPDPYYPSIWISPMFNTASGQKCLRRTCALFEERELGVRYGKDFSAAIRAGHGKKVQADNAIASTAPVPSMEVAALLAKQHRDVVEAGAMPRPGQGPPPATRRIYSAAGFALAEGEDGRWAHVEYTIGEAYEFTAMVAVAGALVLCQELDIVKPKDRSGIVTPAFAFHGSTWADRLRSETFACKEDGCRLQMQVREGRPGEEEVRRCCVEMNRNTLAGEAKKMRGDVLGWS